MPNNFKTRFKTVLALGDILSLTLSFTIAYILRIKLTNRPPAFHINSIDFISSVLLLLPIWIIVMYILGLYDNETMRKDKEIPRLIISSILGVNLMISFAYFTNEPIFPSKLVALYALFISFLITLTVRSLIYWLRSLTIKNGLGLEKLLIIGNDDATTNLVTALSGQPALGYEIVGIVADKKLIPPKSQHLCFRNLESALKLCSPDSIIQTDSHNKLDVYQVAVDHHLNYSYIPSHQALNYVQHSSGIIDSMPIINVKTTPLAGYRQVLKRLVDIVFSCFFLVLSIPFFIIIYIISKLYEPQAPVFFKQKRLSQFNKVVHILKFRSMKQEYSGMSPEEAFAKMGQPELSKQYRANGDQLDDDPRITTLGKFLRKTSLDELPQLWNVLKGDISLVGPRALVPEELKQYPYRNLILTVKSGLTGLAQVSGRRDISFEERRSLDIYYVHNWSVVLDLQIIIKTISKVLFGKGAR